MNKNFDPNKDYEQELIKIQKKILEERGIDENDVIDEDGNKVSFDLDKSIDERSDELFDDIFGEPQTKIGKYIRKEWSDAQKRNASSAELDSLEDELAERGYKFVLEQQRKQAARIDRLLNK